METDVRAAMLGATTHPHVSPACARSQRASPIPTTELRLLRILCQVQGLRAGVPVYWSTGGAETLNLPVPSLPFHTASLLSP